jgi:uncharacterized protein (DUF362 family)
MKLVTLLLIGTLSGGVVFLYQKFFGGEIKNLSKDEFIVGKPKLSISPSTVKHEEIVAVAKAKSPSEGVREVIERTGNLDFIKSGQKVLVKPNVNSDDPAPGTTHPESLAEIVRLVKAKGAYIVVGDRSNPRWGTIAAMKKTGMYEAAQKAGADEIVGFEDEDWVRVKPDQAESWSKGFRIPARLSEFDHIISIPVLHTHSITGHSLAIKNLVGLIHPTDRFIFHASKKRDEMIAEIALAIKPTLTVIEGTKAFIDGGPSSGTMVESKIYLASKDILAADVVGFELLKKEGAKLGNPWSTGQIKHIVELGLDDYNKEEINNEIGKI